MRIIDADKFLEYLIFSKHIDNLKCDEVKKAVEMCEVKQLTVCDIEQIRTEIKSLKIHGTDDVSITNNFVIDKVLQIIDKYR